MNRPDTTAYCADWIHTGIGEPIANGAMLLDANGVILFLGSASDLPAGVVEEKAFPSSVIIPGLVNAHTHLEFSALRAPLGHPGIEFTKWISEVVQHRMKSQSTPAAALAEKANAIRAGLQQSIDFGVTAIGEIATSPLNIDHYLQESHAHSVSNLNSIHVTAFFEQLGSDESVIDERIKDVGAFFRDADDAAQATILPAISPHAPYSVGAKLFDALLKESVNKKSAVAMHVAETMAERAFVEQKTGPFVDMLKRFGVWRPEAYESADSILKILQSLSQADRALVVHGNYLTAQEQDFVASTGTTMSVVYCPRTHAFFEHDRYPLEEMLERGINVAIGTDSRASNPDLDLVAEMRLIRKRHDAVSSKRILQMATASGAMALGLPDPFGSLTVGQKAVFSVIENSDPNAPFAWLT